MLGRQLSQNMVSVSLYYFECMLQVCYLVEALKDCKTTRETQRKCKDAKETEDHYEKLWKAYCLDQAELRKQESVIQKLRADLDKANEQVNILTLKGQERSMEN